MKLLRILTILLFLAALTIYGGYRLKYEGLGDRRPPVIMVPDGALKVSVRADEKTLTKGITVRDDVDGDLTDQLFFESLSDFTENGTRIMNVFAVDAAGNVGEGRREIRYTDYHSPRFSLSEPLAFRGEPSNITAAFGAEDILDGDLSRKIAVSGRYQIGKESGEYPLEFMVTNSAGDTARLTATVVMHETTSLLQMSSMRVELSDYLIYDDYTDPREQRIDAWSYVDRIMIGNHAYEREGDFLINHEEGLNYERYGIPHAIGADLFQIIYPAAIYDGSYEIGYEFCWGEESASTRLIVVQE